MNKEEKERKGRLGIRLRQEDKEASRGRAADKGRRAGEKIK